VNFDDQSWTENQQEHTSIKDSLCANNTLVPSTSDCVAQIHGNKIAQLGIETRYVDEA
jgi:hypothetical protein